MKIEDMDGEAIRDVFARFGYSASDVTEEMVLMVRKAFSEAFKITYRPATHRRYVDQVSVYMHGIDRANGIIPGDTTVPGPPEVTWDGMLETYRTALGKDITPNTYLYSAAPNMITQEEYEVIPTSPDEVSAWLTHPDPDSSGSSIHAWAQGSMSGKLPLEPPAFRIIGVDGGGTTGLCVLDLTEPIFPHQTRFQDTVMMGKPVYTKITATRMESPADPAALRDLVASHRPDVIAVEDFVQLRRAARLSNFRKGGKKASDIAAVMVSLATELGIPATRNSASRAKGWGTDRRLAAAGIHRNAMVHGTDGARHALFTAKEMGYIEDPLLVQARRAQHHRSK